jgi:hypothetical protein
VQLTDRHVATIHAALIAWEDELSEGERWIRSIYDFSEHSPMSKSEVRHLCDQLRRSEPVTCPTGQPSDWRLSVPTYYGAKDRDVVFAEPNVPVQVNKAKGIRIVLGAHDFDDSPKPVVRVERRPHGWAVYIHRDAADPIACILILDNGKTLLLPDPVADPQLEFFNDMPPSLDLP